MSNGDTKQGYHLRPISKGVLGKPSKIREELEELEDACQQGNKILAQVELADLYGALKAVAASFGLTMEDLAKMDEATARAFKSGARQ